MARPRGSFEQRRRRAARDAEQLGLFTDGPAPAPDTPPNRGGAPQEGAASGGAAFPKAPAPRGYVVPTRESVHDDAGGLVDPIGLAWLEFHEANPDVGSCFLGEALNLFDEQIAAGGPRDAVRLSAKEIGEKLRKRFKRQLNNNYWPLYARWAMQERRRLEGGFRLRVRHGEEAGPTK